MVTTLYLVRHGATEGSEIKRYKGNIDVPLSDNGIEQIKKASAFILKHIQNTAYTRKNDYLNKIHEVSSINHPSIEGLSAIYSSNLSRASKSAEIIAAPFGLQPVQIAGLRERSFGIWEGMTFEEIKVKYPVEFKQWSENPLRFSPPGGESTLEVKERVIRVMEGIIANHNESGQNIAVIAHGGVNRIILCHFLGVPLENIFRIEQDNGAVNIIEFWSKYPVVKLVNSIFYCED